MELIPVEHVDEVLKEALILEDGQELFAPEAEVQPFCFTNLDKPEKEVETTVTAH